MEMGFPMVEITLDPMSLEEFETFKERTIRNYADENIKAGYWLSSEAIGRSIEAHQKLLPEGISTEGHHLFMARDIKSKETVGYIWLNIEKNVAIPSGFIFALFIYEQFRGRGYGAAMMKEMEAKASELGLRRLMLHVFAQNPVAIHLYEKSGYCVTSLNMMREIPKQEFPGLSK